MLQRLMDGSRFGAYDDFTEGLSSTRWTTLAPDAGSATAGAGMNGYLSMTPSDGTVADNDEIYVYGKSVFLPTRRRPIYGRVRLQLVEAASNQANFFFGFRSIVSENTLLDDSGGMEGSGIGCVWYKRDKSQYWTVQTRDFYDFQDTVTQTPAGSITRTETIDGVVTSVTPWEELEIFLDDPVPPYTVRDRVQVATFRYNGVPLTDGNGAPIRHELSLLNVEEMTLVVGLKNGTGVAELLLVDSIHGDQVRE